MEKYLLNFHLFPLKIELLNELYNECKTIIRGGILLDKIKQGFLSTVLGILQIFLLLQLW
jgi:hypothetical protein